jgi:hypothetical protein
MVFHITETCAESSVLICLRALSFKSNYRCYCFRSHRRSLALAATLTPGLSLYESFSQPPELARMVFYMPKRFPEITLMIGLVLLSIE